VTRVSYNPCCIVESAALVDLDIAAFPGAVSLLGFFRVCDTIFAIETKPNDRFKIPTAEVLIEGSGKYESGPVIDACSLQVYEIV
jgi:hypothetical protein